MAFVFASFFLDINLKRERPGNIGKKPSFDKAEPPNGPMKNWNGNGDFSEKAVRPVTPFPQDNPFTAENFRNSGRRKRKRKKRLISSQPLTCRWQKR